MTQDFSPLPGALAAGDRVASYEIGEQIGTGGMAVVYRALDTRLGRTVALKVLAPRLAEDDAFRQRFMRESRAAAGVDHPHIIPVFGAGEADGVLFIAMRYVSGGDVRTLLKAEGTLSPARASAIASQAASALDAAHAHGLVHRDVKPGNILIDSASGRDHVYLADFGLSKYAVGANTLTGTGQFMGTLDYVSPEQIQGHRADGRADQYALACTVVEMLCGKPPYTRDESMALLWAQLEAPPPVLTELRADLPAELNAVISTALAKSPAERYPTCLDFAAALAHACDRPPVVLREPTELADRVPQLAAPGAPLAGPETPVPARPDWAAQTRPEPMLAAGSALADALQAGPAEAGPGAAAPPAAGHVLPEPVLAAPVFPAAVLPEAEPAPPREPAQSPWPARSPWPAESPWPAQSSWPAQPPGSAPPQAGVWSPAREPHLVAQRPRRRRTGRRLAGGVLGIAVVAALGLGGYKLMHRQPAAATLPPVVKTKTVSPSPAPLTPAGTVQAYFAAINARDYEQAWRLNTVVHAHQDYNQFVQGLSGTVRDRVTIEATSGNVVTARLLADQSDGTVKTFRGTYTVTNGIISASKVHFVGVQ